MAVVGVSRGHSCSEVARALACATSTVVSAVNRYRTGRRKALLDRRAANGEAKVDERFLAILSRVLAGTPEEVGWCRPTWTRELLAWRWSAGAWRGCRLPPWAVRLPPSVRA
ncbi:helix-turn-helix domain-containing protein [Myxococcus sp. AB036A]|uniref:helix-turn-helix domain-containing protein n=1 Tax=Myxococcus sp. AB036A TaxID=2562793 RepID=UPI001E390C84|nr:helix-turn-helix domain-containing protein [Myxococcus sp. AB036A]